MRDQVRQRLLDLNRHFYATVADDFSATRQHSWPGFAGILPYIPHPAKERPIRVLDVGCGNGRFAAFLAEQGMTAEYMGVDASPALLDLARQRTGDLPGVSTDYRQADLADPAWIATVAQDAPFDLVTCFATFHHLPGSDLRRRVLADLAQLAAADGILALSYWQFLSSHRFSAKLADWAEIGLTPADVEAGDALLPWKRGARLLRYVHHIEDAEADHLAAAAGLILLHAFRADGKEGDLNLYHVLGAGQTNAQCTIDNAQWVKWGGGADVDPPSPNLPISHSHISQPANQPTIKPTNHQTSQPSNQPTIKPANHPSIQQNPMDKRTNEIIAAFLERFEGQPTHLSIGPGRVNLIGEHTDYNDGFVLPVAIEHDVRLVFRSRADRTVRLYSLEFDAWTEFSLDSLAYDEKAFWANYVMGVAWSLQERGIALTGLEGVVSGNVPRGSGLSSSAALEVSCARAFLLAAGVELPGPQIALATQRAENAFVGVNSGIMDQFISVMGQANHALLIDCRSLDYRLIPFPAGAALVIGNTRASRSLASSAYNQRRAECEAGVAALQAVLPGITALRDVTSAQLEEHKALLEPVVYRRCRHVIGENERVIATTEALAAGDLAQVGRLMDASHTSLRDDYAVSSPALDAMVEAMRSAPGTLGARLTGAGFGGCAVALVQAGQEQAVADQIFQVYPQAANLWPDIYISPPSQGSRVMEIQFP